MPFIVIALILAAAIGGGVSVAAQNALPGQALWDFKVGVTERVQDALAADGSAQADFDIAAIGARLREAGRLSADGKLGSPARAKIESNMASHAESAREQIAKLEAAGDYAQAADAAARFQAVLVKENSGALDVRAMLDEASGLSAETSAKTK